MTPNAAQNHAKDKVLLVVVFALLVAGILMIFSASAFWSADRNNDDYARVLRGHLVRVAVGLLLMLVVSRIDYHRYRRWTPHLLLVMAVLLVAVLAAPEFRGSRRAFPLPMGRFHPAEYAKLALVLYLSSVLAKGLDLEKLGPRKLSVHFSILLGVTGLVLLEPDLGSAMVVFVTGMVLFVLAGTPADRLFKLGLGAAASVAAGLALNGYQRDRLLDFLKAKAGLAELPYQLQQSLIAFARGGLFGSGYGGGEAKRLYLPEPFSDFILATLGEEFGFLGVCVLFGLLGLVLWRGTRIALRAPDRYGFLLAGGITTILMVNALINAGVTTTLLPTTGLPFPFISYGGSSLLVMLAGMGVLLNISGQTVASFHQFTNERGRIRWPEVR